MQGQVNGHDGGGEGQAAVEILIDFVSVDELKEGLLGVERTGHEFAGF